jgi:hypothetical protein
MQREFAENRQDYERELESLREELRSRNDDREAADEQYQIRHAELAEWAGNLACQADALQQRALELDRRENEAAEAQPRWSSGGIEVAPTFSQGEASDDDGVASEDSTVEARVYGGDDDAAFRYGTTQQVDNEDPSAAQYEDQNEQRSARFEPRTEEENRAGDFAVNAQQTPSEPAVQPESNEEDESIDDYMSRLLKRVRGASHSHKPQSNADDTRPSPTASQSDEGLARAAAERAAADVETFHEVPARLIARTTAPELSSNLAAMRELANMSARAAIDKHAYRNWGRAAFGKLAIAVLAAAAGCGAIYFAEAPDSMLMYAGLLCFVVTLFWLLQAGILIKNVFMASRRNRFNPAVVDQYPQISQAMDSPVETTPLETGEFTPAEVDAVDEELSSLEVSAECDVLPAAEISSVGEELPAADLSAVDDELPPEAIIVEAVVAEEQPIEVPVTADELPYEAETPPPSAEDSSVASNPGPERPTERFQPGLGHSDEAPYNSRTSTE